ncbi:MAG: GNAT family protein [Bacteroidota bacterium]
MKTWTNPLRLEGQHIHLIPLEAKHRDDLVKAAADGELWELWYTSVPAESTVDTYIATALAMQASGSGLPFVVWHVESEQIIGSTRYCNIDQAHRRLEIGYTWYAKSYQRSAVNAECKLLLLEYAFETLKTMAVELRTHYFNTRSREAIARLGAKQDGILRQHRIDEHGRKRDTVVFSILDSEWPTVRFGLEERLRRGSSR